MSELSGKQIVLGVSGSVAAYKAVYLLRLLVERGAEVWPVLTPSAGRFVGPLTFSALSGHRAVVDLWSSAEAGEIGHVELAHRADVLVLAPATADLLNRLHQGRADDPLSAIALACRAPWVVAPAMESGMWSHPSTQASVTALRQQGARFVEPGAGALASGRSGMGRLAEPEEILEEIFAALGPSSLAGESILVTAGPTREPFDPARFVSNPSTGKMGYAIARVARRRGARVTLISGPTQLPVPPGVEVHRVESTEDMLAACQRHLSAATVLVMAAAPVDYRPAAYSAVKLKKADAGGEVSLAMSLTPDILKSLKGRQGGRIVVGFAAESHDVLDNARRKLHDKDVDLVVANDLGDPEAGFAVDTNRVSIVSRKGVTELPVGSKDVVAGQILDAVLSLRHSA